MQLFLCVVFLFFHSDAVAAVKSRSVEYHEKDPSKWPVQAEQSYGQEQAFDERIVPVIEELVSSVWLPKAIAAVKAGDLDPAGQAANLPLTEKPSLSILSVYDLYYSYTERDSMKTTIASARVGPEETKLLDALAKLQGVDRSALMRQLLQLGLKTYRENAAIMAYANEKVTLGRAAELAGVSQWEMLGLLEKHHVELNYDAHELERDQQALKKQ